MRDFNDLQFFAAVVLNCGFSASSRALKVPKSRISRRVALLEDRLGVRLLDRSTRRLALPGSGNRSSNMRETRSSMLKRPRMPLCVQAEPRWLVKASASLRGRSALLTHSTKGPRAPGEGRTSFVRFAQESRHHAACCVFDEASARAHWRLLTAPVLEDKRCPEFGRCA